MSSQFVQTPLFLCTMIEDTLVFMFELISDGGLKTANFLAINSKNNISLATKNATMTMQQNPLSYTGVALQEPHWLTQPISFLAVGGGFMLGISFISAQGLDLNIFVPFLLAGASTLKNSILSYSAMPFKQQLVVAGLGALGATTIIYGPKKVFEKITDVASGIGSGLGMAALGAVLIGGVLIYMKDSNNKRLRIS